MSDMRNSKQDFPSCYLEAIRTTAAPKRSVVQPVRLCFQMPLLVSHGADHEFYVWTLQRCATSL
jgi:hypothetical protein